MNAPQNAVDCAAADPFQAGVHGGEWDLQVGGFFDVVEADDLDLVGNVDAGGSKRGDGSDGKLVVQRDDAIERHARVDELLRGFGAGSDGPVLAGDADKRRIGRETLFQMRLDDAAQTQFRIAFHCLGELRFIIGAMRSDDGDVVRAPTTTSGKSTSRSSGVMSTTSLMEKIMPSHTVG